jgi:AmmeMemoRadiSam system protein A
MKQKETYRLTDAEKQRLLDIARQSIASYVTTGNLPDFDVSGKLAEPGAAFVTLEKHGSLRGCIGHTMAVQPLYETVAVCAVKAAVADPRFPPVSQEEISELHIEISVLTPLQTVSDLGEIEVGRDGLMITFGGARGLLLPQVATDYGWDRDEFLRQTCRKAGVRPDAYLSPNCRIERFQALIFAEPEPS